MEELDCKENVAQEEKKPNIFKRVWSRICEEKELIVPVVVGLIGLGGSILGLATVREDHRLTRQEQDFERCRVPDQKASVIWMTKEPMTNDEYEEMLDREKSGESRREVLKKMGKI